MRFGASADVVGGWRKLLPGERDGKLHGVLLEEV